jgi:hypothetical protein
VHEHRERHNWPPTQLNDVKFSHLALVILEEEKSLEPEVDDGWDPTPLIKYRPLKVRFDSQ